MESGFDSDLGRDDRSSEIDIRALWQVLVRKRAFILVPTCAAFVITWALVLIITPRYTAESQVLIENQENFFTRPQKDTSVNEGLSLVDPEAVGSQIQLVTSRDLARRAIKALQLEGNPEFDPLADGIGPLSRVLILLNLMRDPTRTPPEERILQSFQERLSVFSPTKTRVLTIDFQSRDPELAARAANKIAELYLSEQSDAKRTRAKAAAASLEGLITDLRGKLTEASAQVEEFRSSSGLLAGSNNMTITGQQLAELNTELSRARTSQADAQAKAALIKDMIKQGRIASVPDVANNDLVRRIAEQRVTARAQLASDLRVFLPGHPHIQELTAQIADLDNALRGAADQTIHALENEARIAGNRVGNLESVLSQQKKVAGVANVDEVHLRELERIADAYKDQLESSTTKYQEALAREDSPATPADARIISRAVKPVEATYPKKLPLVIFATLATFLGTSGWIVAGELFSSRAAIGASGLRKVSAPRFAGTAAAFAPLEPVEPSMDIPSEDESEVAVPLELKRSNRLTTKLLAREIAAKAKPGRGMCIVTTGLTQRDKKDGFEIALGRDFAERGHAIVLDLEGDFAKFAPLFSGSGDAPENAEELKGLGDLVAGNASFAEVIHRDAFSRLHFIPSGHDDHIDADDLELVIEALSQTYDFILLMAAPFEHGEAAFVLAVHADAVVVALTTAKQSALDELDRDLMEAGAGEVIFVKDQMVLPERRNVA